MPQNLSLDNLEATYLTSNPVYHSQTKCMDIDFHFVRDRVAAKTLNVQFCKSKDQLADIFIKSLVSDHFFPHQLSLCVLDPHLTHEHISLSHNGATESNIEATEVDATSTISITILIFCQC